MPISILDLAKHMNPELENKEGISMKDLDDLGLPFFGGCATCEASCACYNMYPSKDGYVRCRNCIDSATGWSDAAEAQKDLFADV